jgi:lipoprotein NlpI
VNKIAKHAFGKAFSPEWFFHIWRTSVYLCVLLTADSLSARNADAAQETKNEALLKRAVAAYAGGKRNEAIVLATQAIEAEPNEARSYLVRAQLYSEGQQPAKAIVDYDTVLKLEPELANAWQHRGEEHFKLGQVKESLADFDKFIALVPGRAAYLWQRGITCYYAGRFEEGRKQFELHRTVNPNDVENAVWHFLCVAQLAGLEQARAGLIPIKGDSRVPMMEIYALFGGKAKPEDVLKAARAANEQPGRAMFYAHLYLGLYAEANGEMAQAREHIAKAAAEYRTDDYMGDVARVHLLLRAPGEKPVSGETKVH